jgi:hypothetical protein
MTKQYLVVCATLNTSAYSIYQTVLSLPPESEINGNWEKFIRCVCRESIVKYVTFAPAISRLSRRLYQRELPIKLFQNSEASPIIGDPNLEVPHLVFGVPDEIAKAGEQISPLVFLGERSGALSSISGDPSRMSQTDREDTENRRESRNDNGSYGGDGRIFIRNIRTNAMPVRWDKADENGDAFFKMLGGWIVCAVCFYALLKIQ